MVPSRGLSVIKTVLWVTLHSDTYGTRQRIISFINSLMGYFTLRYIWYPAEICQCCKQFNGLLYTQIHMVPSRGLSVIKTVLWVTLHSDTYGTRQRIISFINSLMGYFTLRYIWYQAEDYQLYKQFNGLLYTQIHMVPSKGLSVIKTVLWVTLHSDTYDTQQRIISFINSLMGYFTLRYIWYPAEDYQLYKQFNGLLYTQIYMVPSRGLSVIKTV